MGAVGAVLHAFYVQAKGHARVQGLGRMGVGAVGGGQYYSRAKQAVGSWYAAGSGEQQQHEHAVHVNQATEQLLTIQTASSDEGLTTTSRGSRRGQVVGLASGRG